MSTDVQKPRDTFYDNTMGYGRPHPRLAQFWINPEILVGWLTRTIRFSGLPPDVEYVRSWHDDDRGLICVIVQSQTFEESYVGVPPYRIDVFAADVTPPEEP